MEKTVLISEEKIVNRIYFIRGKKVMLDKDLAEMYGVVTGQLNRAVKRNLRRFPDDFMFQLTDVEFAYLISQSVISNSGQNGSNLVFQSGTSNPMNQDVSLECQIGIPKKPKRGGAWTLPYVFTEQGVAMLSSVLNSDTSIDVNIQIIRVFTRMREVLLSQKDVILKIEKLEKAVSEQNTKVGNHDEEIREIFLALKGLMETGEKVEQPPIEKVGYKRSEE